MISNADDNEPKKPTLFDMLTMIETVKTPWKELTEDQQKAYAPYMINRFVSSKEIYAPAVAQIDTLKLTPEQHYAIMCELVSNTHRNYFDYKAYKKNKEPDKNYDLLVWACSKEYEIGAREAKMYLNDMKSEVKEQLIQKWEEPYKTLKKS
ncbi:MAG: hypothetical protein J6T10_04425 [Methanobrevibacter sp.]|nr:hypothetical protein [Methanobrevibacter sp.]